VGQSSVADARARRTLLGIALGLLAGFTYGAADFIGGLASRRSSALSVVVISQAAGLVLFVLLLPLLPHASPKTSDIIWGFAAGVAGGIGIVLLYRGLAIGRMSMVSPVTAVLGAVIPLAVALLRHERPSLVALSGVGLALIAVALVSGSEHPGESTADPDFDAARAPHAKRASRALWGMPAGLPEAIVSGIAIGGFLLFLAQTKGDAGLWPLAASRVSSIAFLTALALIAGRSLRPQAGSLGAIVFAGVLDMTANASYLIATRHGLLSLVVVLASLYPASTVLLARVVLKERLTAVQLAGVACALTAIALIAGGSHA